MNVRRGDLALIETSTVDHYTKGGLVERTTYYLGVVSHASRDGIARKLADATGGTMDLERHYRPITNRWFIAASDIDVTGATDAYRALDYYSRPTDVDGFRAFLASFRPDATEGTNR